MIKSDCIHIDEYQDMGARMCVCDLAAPLIQEPRCDSCAFYTRIPKLSYEQIVDYCKEHDLTLIPKDTLRKLQAESVKHGRWIDKGWNGDWQFQTDGRGNSWHEWECSECEFITKGAKWNFCPNCGARMDLDEVNNG